ncbi:MAG: 23S rRNA (adenine(2503)-C(2))-methyltransferase RlmN [Deltaproteobacteria bacterium]|nr:23S rRNA (adenine(2503)-C(2))-methyltransferase RlmN [Deltaproteobacteria bacterium]
MTPFLFMSKQKLEILDYPRKALAALLTEQFEVEPFRANQLFPWIYRSRHLDFSQMTDISKSVREVFSENFNIYRPKRAQMLASKDGSYKFLWELDDSSNIESVLIKQSKRVTLCLSSQVGCAMRCAFCVTGTLGLKRDLQVHEIIGQVIAVRDAIAEHELEDFGNIVFMGMGEPLHNIDNVIAATEILNDEYGFNFSGRKITISTSGLVNGIRQLGQSKAKANLAISLNATTDEVRKSLMPVNKRYPLEVLMAELRRYPLKAHRRITFEYVLIKGVNDSRDDQKRLIKLLRGIPSKVNIIPYNPGVDLGYETPSREVIVQWQENLLGGGLNATIRWSKADDINGACGQLAAKHK